jgi:hypothetical protein
MPEWWLAAHGLTNRDLHIEALDDQDGDGMLTWEEWHADTVPTDPDSVLRFTRIERSNGHTRLVWQGGVEARQWLESLAGPGPGPGPWVPVFTNPPPTSPATDFLHQSPACSASFYRIRVQRPDE